MSILIKFNCFQFTLDSFKCLWLVCCWSICLVKEHLGKSIVGHLSVTTVRTLLPSRCSKVGLGQHLVSETLLENRIF